jgi:beta-hydroxylase
MDWAMIETRHWVLLVFIASALYVHMRGTVRFKLVRALFDFTVLLAPVNALMYLFSRTRQVPFIDQREFPEIQLLNDHWQTIRDEAMALADGGQIQAAKGYTDLGFNSFFRTGWKRFYLTWYGKELPSAMAQCPKTLALLKQIPTIKAAMFASLPPGATLQRHRDPYAGSLRYHLGLVTPNDPACFIEVDGQRYHWKDGESVMFDETYIHHAANDTQQQRVVLFCDIERPLWTAPMRWFNRVFAKHVLGAASSANVEGEGIGGLNQFFKVFYQVRLRSKQLKASNRQLYYLSKWVAILGLLWLLFW